MQARAIYWCTVLLSLAVSPAWAQFDSGSDGSDGPFNPQANIEVDLSLAPTGTWNDPNPNPGQGIGVYDPYQWAVVFRYTTIDIPDGVTVTFKNHRSNPPVIWLASGDVNVYGVIDVSGQDGAPRTEQVSIAQPGPGGFEGGRRGDFAHGPLPASCGCGPGSGCYSPGAYAEYAGYGPGPYGNIFVFPLIGGSGGCGGWYCASTPMHWPGDGGAGGGAILIASSGEISLHANGGVAAHGGSGGAGDVTSYNGYGGSGGAIRLIANRASGSGTLRALGTGVYPGSVGRIRVEAYDFDSLTDPGSPNWTAGFPGAIFVSPAEPRLRATLVDGVSVPIDPEAGRQTPDVLIGNYGSVTIHIEAENVPAGTTVQVIVLPQLGEPSQTMSTFTSTPLVDGGSGILTATADAVIPSGRSEIQLRANWTP